MRNQQRELLATPNPSEYDATRLTLAGRIATGAVSHIGGARGFPIGCRSRHNSFRTSAGVSYHIRLAFALGFACVPKLNFFMCYISKISENRDPDSGHVPNWTPAPLWVAVQSIILINPVLFDSNPASNSNPSFDPNSSL
ncbi:hypothetical protein EVAR_96646_1 [Eumeta japonica]|uniref:Uncharacterized protein n=1 Tax=Eumeta variegata TaxID=151549 RepID=A0A4C2A5G4_EUMVA|nr:hypothetical protein EVAR_96646_1 [Eumeta japonica]